MTFQGRLGRLAFFGLTVISSVILSLPGFFFWNAEQVPNFVAPSGWFYLIGWVIGLIGFLLLWTGTVRRLHDMDWSGWWCILVYLFPVLLFVLWLWPGTAGYNRFGSPW